MINSYKSNGAKVLVTSRDKDVSLELPRRNKIRFVNLGKPGVFKMMALDLQFLNLLHKYKPMVAISTASPSLAQACFLSRIPHLVFGDTEQSRHIYRASVPFSCSMITPESFIGSYGDKHIKYNGYHELAYLHPKYYTPGSSF